MKNQSSQACLKLCFKPCMPSAKETKTRGAIKDTKAVEIIDKINYDFSLADKDSAMHSGVVARTIVLDKLAKQVSCKKQRP